MWIRYVLRRVLCAANQFFWENWQIFWRCVFYRIYSHTIRIGKNENHLARYWVDSMRIVVRRIWIEKIFFFFAHFSHAQISLSPWNFFIKWKEKLIESITSPSPPCHSIPVGPNLMNNKRKWCVCFWNFPKFLSAFSSFCFYDNAELATKINWNQSSTCIRHTPYCWL